MKFRKKNVISFKCLLKSIWPSNTSTEFNRLKIIGSKEKCDVIMQRSSSRCNFSWFCRFSIVNRFCTLNKYQMSKYFDWKLNRRIWNEHEKFLHKISAEVIWAKWVVFKRKRWDVWLTIIGFLAIFKISHYFSTRHTNTFLIKRVL